MVRLGLDIRVSSCFFSNTFAFARLRIRIGEKVRGPLFDLIADVPSEAGSVKATQHELFVVRKASSCRALIHWQLTVH